MPQLPLTGIRILSIEQYGAGPWATMMLADLGAEVIKIENPRSDGDVGRYVPPYTGDKDSIYFQSFNRNKKSITLDIQHEKAFSVLHPLVKASDCVFNNLRGDLPAKLGLDYQALKDIDPSVVCCSLSAFGRSGSRMSEPGYDYLMQAYTGWMSITGEPDGPPQKTGPSIVDLSAGITASLATLAAIMRSRETGIGCDVDVSLFDTALSELAYVASWHLTKGYQPRRFRHSSHPSQVPSQLLPTKDGWMVVMCAKEKFYRSLVEIMGMPSLGADPRFATFEDRLTNRDVLLPIL
ncbi:MAG: CoA transferase, partial [Anaerolineales bacterium]|nr:CoA transferase [Anaerolineales bacterium]